MVHMHEEPRVGVDADPLGSLLGTADAIRHRFGVSGGAGVDLPVGRSRFGDVYLAFDVSTTHFPDDRGPGWYVDGVVSAVFDHAW